jgi:4-hydroxybenzoyl-CoA reductase subunit beta
MSAPLPDFGIVRPSAIEAALTARRDHKQSRFLAGGTDLVVNMRRGLAKPETIIDLSAIDELGGLKVDSDGVRIGATVTLAEIAAAPEIQSRYRAVREAAAAIAGPGHRAVATIGGNLCLDTRCIYYNQSEWWRRANGYCLKHAGTTCHVAPQGNRCHAAFSGDLAPAFMVFDAEVEIAGLEGRRRIALAELYAEDGRAHLTLADDELIVAVFLPPDAPPSGYLKTRVRGAIDFPLAGVAVALGFEAGVVRTLRVALTGTNSRPFLLAETESFLGKPLDEPALRRLDKLVQKQVQPMRTTLVSAQYRRLAAATQACRLAARLVAAAEQPQ